MNEPNLIETRLRVMVELQETHNRLVHPEWARQGFEYYRAIWVECAELLDHFGWKWWKKQEPDLDQVRLEIVDIWHFGLSEMIRCERLGPDRVDPAIVRAVAIGLAAAPGDFRSAVELLAQQSLADRDFPLSQFIAVMRALPMSFEELYRHYVGKNVLNQFRQAHGYKSGGYRKLWSGREDNVHLMEITARLDDRSPRYADELLVALSARYEAGLS